MEGGSRRVELSGQMQTMAERTGQQAGTRHVSCSLPTKRDMKGSAINFGEKIEAAIEGVATEGV